jgi:hypothetical protein
MDVLVKGIPDGISEAQVKDWVAVLIERFENAKVNQIQAVREAVVAAQTGIDGFRKANALTPKFEKAVEPEQG